CEVDIGPSHAQRLAAAAPGQQQQPDDIGGLLIRVLGQRLGQPLKLVAAQISPALALVVALDVSARVVAAHAPAHRKREHFRDQRERSVGSKRLALCGEAAVQTVDVGEGDVADLGVQAEEGTHMVAQRATILARRARGFSREMLGLEPVAQLGDRGSGALLLEIAERVDAAIYLLLQPLGLLPRRRGPPDRGRPYGEPALAAGAASAVVEDERPGAGGGDAAAEPRKIAVVMDLAALLGSGESLNDRVGKPGRHFTPPCPNSIRRFDGIPCPIHGEACPGLSTRKRDVARVSFTGMREMPTPQGLRRPRRNKPSFWDPIRSATSITAPTGACWCSPWRTAAASPPGRKAPLPRSGRRFAACPASAA